MKRLLVYVHFNKYNQLSPHVLYQLEKLKPLFERVIFLSNSQLSKSDRAQINELKVINQLVQRQNIGFDFAAWRDGIQLVGWKQLKEFDSITFMNDTNFGPFWDLEPIFQKMEANNSFDFWGMTNFRQFEHYPEHLQSYFLTFKKNVIESETFKDFWFNVKDHQDVEEVIKDYELKLTATFVDAGFNYGAVFDTLEEDMGKMPAPDFTYFNPTRTLQVGLPFVKIKALEVSQGIAPYVMDTISKESDYPIHLITNHMSMVSQPDRPYLLGQKYMSAKPLPTDFEAKVAIHLHVFYTDLLHDFLKEFENFSFTFDLYVTTDSEKKKKVIESILSTETNIKEILVTGNKGRDIYPMLLLKDQLSQYDYVGHFHTKKSKEADFWAGESWRQELIESLVQRAEDILANFEANPQLGLAIADIPTFFRYNRIVTAENEALMAPAMQELWERMGSKKQIQFSQLDTFVMSYGTFIWFRYDSLKPLFDLDLKETEIPEEPLQQNSILHAIERLVVYIVWDQNYDFIISPNPKHITPFLDNKQLNLRGISQGSTYVDFNQLGGIKGALKYIFTGPASAIKYIITRLKEKCN